MAASSKKTQKRRNQVAARNDSKARFIKSPLFGLAFVLIDEMGQRVWYAPASGRA